MEKIWIVSIVCLKCKFQTISSPFNHRIMEIYFVRLWPNDEPSSLGNELNVDFIRAISVTNYTNLGELRRFENMSKFNNVDFLMIAREAKKKNQLANNYFTHVITEVKVQNCSGH